MRIFKTLSLISVLLILGSCQFSQSVNKDLTTGAYSRGDGLASDEVIMEVNGKVEKRNEFFYGEKVNLIFNNVNGFKKHDNKSHPELAIYIVKNEKDTVLSNFNLLKNLENGTDISPLQLQANFTTALPYQNNEKYKVYVEIGDKKGEGKFSYEMPFTIKENDLLAINNNELQYSNIYLWNENLKQPVVDKTVNADQLLILILNGVEGFELENGKAFPIFSLDITDANGNKIISSPNLLNQFEDDGVDPEDLKKQLTAKINFTEGKINNPCKLIAKVKDKNSTKEINIKTQLIIQ